MTGTGPSAPFTEPWARALRQSINASTEYRDVGRTWQWPLALILDARPELGYPEASAVLLDLRDGRCEAASVVPADTVTAPFAVSGDYDIWKRVIVGSLDPIAAIVQGKLRLTGNLGTVVRHVHAAQALVVCAGTVPTVFPDESR